jgi:hypothetical protein
MHDKGTEQLLNKHMGIARSTIKLSIQNVHQSMIDYQLTAECENICYNLDDSFHCGNCCNVYGVDLSLYVPSIYTVFNKNKLSNWYYIYTTNIYFYMANCSVISFKKIFKVEKLSLGGVNVLFNESGTLYRKSIKNHLIQKELSLS